MVLRGTGLVYKKQSNSLTVEMKTIFFPSVNFFKVCVYYQIYEKNRNVVSIGYMGMHREMDG